MVNWDRLVSRQWLEPRDRLESRDRLKSRDKLESKDRIDPKDETGARETQLFSLDSLIGLIGTQGNKYQYPSTNLFLSDIQILNDQTWKCLMTNYANEDIPDQQQSRIIAVVVVYVQYTFCIVSS